MTVNTEDLILFSRRYKFFTFIWGSSFYSMMKLFLMAFVFFISTELIGQINSAPKAPTFGTPQPINPGQSYTPSTQNKHLTRSNINTPNKPNVKYPSSKPDYIQQRKEHTEAVLKEIKDESQTPKLTNQAPYFLLAYNSIESMLQKDSFDLKRAVYLSENALYGGTMDYTLFKKEIDNLVTKAKLMMKQKNYSMDNNLAKNMVLHQLFKQEFKYDFEDPFGHNDYSKMLVTKLLHQKTGQCKTLPLLYLILAQELDAKAWLSYSPSHSYIQCKDNDGNMYNVELTNGHITSDDFIMASGYVKSEAIMNLTYMDTLGTKKVVASLLTSLSKSYTLKHRRMDDFNLKCLNTNLKYHPENIFAILAKSDYYTVELNRAMKQKGYKTIAQINSNYQLKKLFEKRNRYYDYLDYQIGYEQIPEPVYMDWLNSISEKQFEEQDKQKFLELNKALD